MTAQEKEKYEASEALKDALKSLAGRNFQLDCGHHVTIGHNLGNDIVIQNGKDLQIICSLCSY